MDKENHTAQKIPLSESHHNFICETPKVQNKPIKKDQILSAVEE